MKIFNSGLNEIINEDSKSQSELQFSVKLPKIPKEFSALIQDFDVDEIEKKYHTCNQVCDCQGEDQSLIECPHFSDPSFAALYSQIPQRLELLKKAQVKDEEEIRMNLFRNVIITLEKLPCRTTQSEYQSDSSLSQQEYSKLLPGKYQPKVLTNELQQERIYLPKTLCHIYRDLKEWFPEEFDKYFKLGKYQEKPIDPEIAEQMNRKKNSKVYQFFHPDLPTLAINLSFCSNILLLILKIICFAISRSMSILSSMVDSATDILCGLVMFVAVKIAKHGIQKGQYQQFLHGGDKPIKIIYARRFETLGQLSFSWIMACLSILLIYESISQIIDYSKGQDEDIDFSAIPMSIIGFTIVLKFCLSVLCFTTAKKHYEQRDVVLAYAQDHRNDVLSNTIGFLGATLTYYLGGDWKYADPSASTILSCYIFYNWFSNAIESMKQLAGTKVEKEELNDLLMRLFQFSSTIYVVAIDQLLAYYSGSSIIVEMRLQLPDNLSLHASHQIVQEIQNEYEKLPIVERCYIHVECDSAINIL